MPPPFLVVSEIKLSGFISGADEFLLFAISPTGSAFRTGKYCIILVSLIERRFFLGRRCFSSVLIAKHNFKLVKFPLTSFTGKVIGSSNSLQKKSYHQGNFIYVRLTV